MTAPAFEARFRLTKRGAGTSFAIDVALSLPGGVLVLFGPSGAGKTLCLEGILGLTRPDEGLVRVLGEALFDSGRGVDVPPHLRRVGYVPQRSSLFPFTDVRGNVAFGLPRKERPGPVAAALIGELGLAHRARARPDDLSGGERQRVSLARALAASPRLLLLDEPFASIDREGRAALGDTLRALLARRGTPAVLVTHDRGEAEAMGDWLVPIDEGRTGESAPPREFFAARR